MALNQTIIVSDAVAAAASLHGTTFARLKAAMYAALGRSTLDEQYDAGELVNGAVLALASAGPWTWRERSLSLGLTEAQPYAVLPADCGELAPGVGLYRSGWTLPMRPCTLGELLRRRQSGAPSGGPALYAVSHQRQATAADPSRHRLELWPTPDATVADAIAGVYLCVPRLLVAENDAPDLPRAWHPLAVLWVRAHALELHDDPAAPAAWEACGKMIESLRLADARGQANLGGMRGAVWRERASDLVDGTISTGGGE